MDDSRGFLAALFDTSFTSFITTRIIKLLFLLSILMAGIVALGVVVSGFSHGFATGLLALLIGAPLVFVFAVIQARVLLELTLVVFRIAEHAAGTEAATRALVERSGGERA